MLVVPCAILTDRGKQERHWALEQWCRANKTFGMYQRKCWCRDGREIAKCSHVSMLRSSGALPGNDPYRHPNYQLWACSTPQPQIMDWWLSRGLCIVVRHKSLVVSRLSLGTWQSSSRATVLSLSLASLRIKTILPIGRCVKQISLFHYHNMTNPFMDMMLNVATASGSSAIQWYMFCSSWDVRWRQLWQGLLAPWRFCSSACWC